MGFLEMIIEPEDFQNREVTGLPDRPSEQGITASALKAMFDAPSKQVVAPKFNALINALSDPVNGGAGGITVQPITGLAGNNVQTVLAALKELLDTKETSEQHDADMATKLDITEAESLVKSIDFDDQNGKFTFTKYDGSTTVIDTALEKVTLDVRLDGQQFVLRLIDGTEQRVDLSEFLTEYDVADSDTVSMQLQNHVLSAEIKDGSIQQRHLGQDIGGFVAGHAQEAKESAEAAAISEQNARYSEQGAANSAASAASSAESASRDADYVQEQAAEVVRAAEVAQNNADRVVNAVSDFASDIVSTSDEQPTSTYNRLWFPGITRTLEIVTTDEVREEVAKQVGPGIDEYLEQVDFSQYAMYVGKDENGIYFDDGEA